ncbi:DUF1638 domain-containing protein [Thermincola ferriacetica]
MDKNIALVIACEAFRGELDYFKDSIDVEVLWVQHSLHNTPDQLKLELMKKIEEAEKKLKPGSTVLLMFGNCGGALNSLKSRTLALIYPDVADCIPIILGSMDRYKKLQKEKPGTFYLNKAWIDSGEDPLGSSKKYINMYGEEKGWKVTKRMYKNYTHFTLIDNGCYDLEKYRQYTMAACEKFGKAYSEEKGDLSFVEAILNRQCPMVSIPPCNSETTVAPTY